MLLGYAALNTYLLMKIRPVPISFMPLHAETDERVSERLAA